MYDYKLSDIRIIDGDSIEATLDRGMDDYSRKIIRLYGIDAPESRTRDLDEKKEGLKSKDWLVERIEKAVESELDVILQSHKKTKGKYGRLLGTLIIQGIDVNQQMLTLELARPYFGGRKK